MPVKINSGFRSQRVNEAIPGSAKVSQHLEGKAADIVASGLSVLDLFKRVLQLGLPFDQIIYEAKSPQSKWVHVSHDAARRRGEIMVANFQPGGKVSYTRITQEAALGMSEPALRGRVMPMEFEESHDAPVDEAPAPKAPAKKAAAKKKVAVKKAATKAAPKESATQKPAVKKAAPKKARRGARPSEQQAVEHPAFRAEDENGVTLTCATPFRSWCSSTCQRSRPATSAHQPDLLSGSRAFRHLHIDLPTMVANDE